MADLSVIKVKVNHSWQMSQVKNILPYKTNTCKFCKIWHGREGDLWNVDIDWAIPRNCPHPKTEFPLFFHSKRLLQIYKWPQTKSSVWAVTGLIEAEHFALYFHTSVFSPPVQDMSSAPSHVKTLSCFFDVGEGSSRYPSSCVVKLSSLALDEKMGLI